MRKITIRDVSMVEVTAACMCTCTKGQYWSCGSSGFWCVDPDGSPQEANLCLELPSPIPVCPVRLQSEWVVESTIQAQALVKAVRCSGGSFHVARKGKVILDEMISILNGTFLNATSAGAGSTIVGDGKFRLFSVVNASLHLCNITLSNGNTTYGGAIAVSGSRLTFESVAFIGNVAASSVGAIFLSHKTSFSGKSATSGNGGTLYVEAGSNVSWTGNSIFSKNTCWGDGGAVFLTGGSYALWTVNTTFIENVAAQNGGALYLIIGSSIVGTAKACFLGNSARLGGALILISYFVGTWTTESYFVDNRAIFGGALYVSYISDAPWAGNTFFSANTANVAGGALYMEVGSVVTWNAKSYFLENCTGSYGGALSAWKDCRAARTAAALFSTTFVYVMGVRYSPVTAHLCPGVKLLISSITSPRQGGLFSSKMTCE